MSNSSSKKKRPLIQQCQHCGCCFGAKDFEAHRAGRQQSPATPTSTAAGQNGDAARDNNECCRPMDFETSELALVEPGHGLALRPHTLGPTQWDALFPVPLHGWERRHAAVVHPETLVAAGTEPRSAAVWTTAAGEERSRLLTLWPNPEVPPMRIALRPEDGAAASTTTSTTQGSPTPADSSALIRLAFPSISPTFVSKMSLRPQLSGSHTPPAGCWTRLAQLPSFPLFLRSYFANALVCEECEQLELYYYGHCLSMRIIGMEFGEDGQRGRGLESETEDERTNGNGRRKEEKKLKQFRVHRISPMAKLDIDWGDVREDEKQEWDNSRTEDEDELR